MRRSALACSVTCYIYYSLRSSGQHRNQNTRRPTRLRLSEGGAAYVPQFSFFLFRCALFFGSRGRIGLCNICYLCWSVNGWYLSKPKLKTTAALITNCLCVALLLLQSMFTDDNKVIVHPIGIGYYCLATTVFLGLASDLASILSGEITRLARFLFQLVK